MTAEKTTTTKITRKQIVNMDEATLREIVRKVDQAKELKQAEIEVECGNSLSFLIEIQYGSTENEEFDFGGKEE